MSVAGRHGKLDEGGDWERIEDLLTADVFGAYRYLPTELGVVPFLEQAMSSGGQTFAQWVQSLGGDASKFDTCHVHLWPTLDDNREPDLLLFLESSSAKIPSIGILIEAKLHSLQHEIDGRSQLGHYGAAFAAGRLADNEIRRPLPSRRVVMYLTKSKVLPSGELLRARMELDQAGATLPLFWLSWHHARSAAQAAWDKHGANVLASPWLRVLEDLLADLDHRGIRAAREYLTFPLPSLIQLGDTPEWLMRTSRPPSFLDFAETPLSDISEELAAWRL